MGWHESLDDRTADEQWQAGRAGSLEIEGNAEHDAGQVRIENGLPDAAAAVIHGQITIPCLQCCGLFQFVAQNAAHLIFQLRTGPPSANIAENSGHELR